MVPCFFVTIPNPVWREPQVTSNLLAYNAMQLSGNNIYISRLTIFLNSWNSPFAESAMIKLFHQCQREGRTDLTCSASLKLLQPTSLELEGAEFHIVFIKAK